MREHRIFVEAELLAGAALTLPQAACHHLLVVLRAKVGQPLILCNNTGVEAIAAIEQLDKKSAVARIQSVETIERESPLKIHLAIGISRGERMEFVLQKSTELGASAITPLWCERTEVKLDDARLQKKMQHWQQIILNACEQCGRTRLPVLHAPQRVHDFTSGDINELRFVLHHRSAHALPHARHKPVSVSLLIGPEGGLSEAEISSATQAGFSPLTLGPRVLRTETAPLVALSLLQCRWGDLS